MYHRSRLVFCPESNLGLEHHHLNTLVGAVADSLGLVVTTFWEGKEPGTRKTEKSTREYQFLLSNALAQQGVVFDRDLFTATREKDVPAMMAMLQEQMLRFHWAVKKGGDEHSKDRVKLTGKVGNAQDDLLIALMMLLYIGRMVIKDPSRLEVLHV